MGNVRAASCPPRSWRRNERSEQGHADDGTGRCQNAPDRGKANVRRARHAGEPGI